MTQVRLHLVGDDEALDLLAELSRHLPLIQLSRGDAFPRRDLDEQDVVVIGASHVRIRESLLRTAIEKGKPLHVLMLGPPDDQSATGARAILMAAELVRLLMPHLRHDKDLA